jgi:hypothetical protein
MGAGVSMNPHRDVYGRLERIKALWKEIANTPKKSERYEALTQEIRAEAVAYLAGVDTAIAGDRRRKGSERRRHDTAEDRVNRRKSARRK